MEKEEKFLKRNVYKIFLLSLKFSPHFIAIIYIIYTILNVCGEDLNTLGCLFHVSLVTWVNMLMASIVFRFCYIHRIPIYYIGLNELITCIDYYINIPVDIFTIISIHILLIIFMLFGYSYYMIIDKNKIKRKHPFHGEIFSKETVVTGFDVETVNSKIKLTIIGENIESENYSWNITIGDKTITPTSKNSYITLNASNSKKYLENNLMKVQVKTENYISPIYEFKKPTTTTAE